MGDEKGKFLGLHPVEHGCPLYMNSSQGDVWELGQHLIQLRTIVLGRFC